MIRIKAKKKAKKAVDNVNRYCEELTKRVKKKYPNNPEIWIEVAREEIEKLDMTKILGFKIHGIGR